MRGLQDFLGTAALRQLQLRMRPVLRAAGGQRPAGQSAAAWAPGRHRAPPPKPTYHPLGTRYLGSCGFDTAYRQPDPDETGLSVAEIARGMEIGVIA